MVEISYLQMVIAISIIWFIARVICWVKAKGVDRNRELQLLLAYICIVVVVRFTFCPFGKVDGTIQPLLFDAEKILPLWVNFKPFIYLFDYPTMGEALLNLIGNITMFIPVGIVWPIVFKDLDKPWKVIAAGVGFSLIIEIIQLPFFDRLSDIDDLILNSAGYLIGYGIVLLVRACRKRK